MSSAEPPSTSDSRSAYETGFVRVLTVALAGSLLFWAALPPLELSWLAWIAPVPWLVLVQWGSLTGRRPYVALWLAYFAFWLLSLHWLRLPHPALYLGWLALAAYLAIYLPLFVGITRVAVHRVRIPLWVAAPVVWTGLELARAHLLTGFLMASFAHTQVGWTQLIQISDLFGEYGVDFVVMLVAACVASAFRISGIREIGNVTNPESARQVRFHPLLLLPAVVALAATLYYGHVRLNEANQVDAASNRTFRIALIQGNSLAEWKFDPDSERKIMDEYVALSEKAVAKAREDGRPIDLLVWPETMFRSALVSFDNAFQMPPGSPRTKEQIAAIGRDDMQNLATRLGVVALLLGVDRFHFEANDPSDATMPRPRRFNSVALFAGEYVQGAYDKNHRVMFGEYIPFASFLPFLYRITPLTGGIEAGEKAMVFDWNYNYFAPSICYETVIPHVMRRQARATTHDGHAADVLINVTNDAWYRGSNELDLHLACGIFRAVETRKPLMIAANGGISAWIDRTGRIRAESPRQQPDVILADVKLGAMSSPYVALGDWFAAVCLTACVLLAIIGILTRHKSSPPSPAP